MIKISNPVDLVCIWVKTRAYATLFSATIGAVDDPLYEDDHDTDENIAQMTEEQLVHSNMAKNFREVFID